MLRPPKKIFGVLDSIGTSMVRTAPHTRPLEISLSGKCCPRKYAVILARLKSQSLEMCVSLTTCMNRFALKCATSIKLSDVGMDPYRGSIQGAGVILEPRNVDWRSFKGDLGVLSIRAGEHRLER